MNTYTAKRPHIDGRSYETCFWDTMRGKIPRENAMEKGVDPASGAFVLMPKVQSRFQAELEKENLELQKKAVELDKAKMDAAADLAEKVVNDVL